MLAPNWRDTVPLLHAPRHPLWLDAYSGAWELLARAPIDHTQPDARLLAMCLRYALDADALADWLDQFDANDPLRPWCEWECYQHSFDAVRLARVLPQLVEQFALRSTHTPRSSLRATTHEALAAECIAHAARALGDERLAHRFTAEWRARCTALNQQYWQEPLGFYMDESSAKTSTGFWPLLVGAPSQANAITKHLVNPDEFWRVHVAPSLSADQPRYADRGAARRGSVYPQDNYAIIKGLERYAQHRLALRVADNHITTVSHVFKETRALWDNYAPDYIEPGSIAHPDEPLAALSAIALLIETLFGLRVDAPQRTLHWMPRLRETHGIERLRVDEAIVRAHVVERDGALQAQLATSAPLRLHWFGPNGEQWLEVQSEFLAPIT